MSAFMCGFVRQKVSLAVMAGVLGAAPLASADVVLDWNDVYLDTVRAEGGPPCPVTRAGAMLHTAMYDAINSIERTHEPYLTLMEAPAGTSREAAAAAAGHRVMTHLYPSRSAIYDAALDESLGAIPAGPGRDAGVALGVAVADRIIDERADDGTQADPPYVYESGPGHYQPTYPDFTSPPYNPGWGGSRPWTMIAGKHFRPDGPEGYVEMSALLTSAEYAEAFNEVKDLGARQSATRTPEQTMIAFFWANDLDGTTKPPGQYNTITATLARQQGLSLSEKARLFALTSLAMADAGLAAWDAKYNTDIDLWRPITAVREADSDGNPATVGDPGWLPLKPFNPPFPAWVSGHSTFSAAHATAMMYFFGTDEMSFEVESEDIFYIALGGGPRQYDSFWEAAMECSLSRVYLGVHFRFDCLQGTELGEKVGRYVATQMLMPVCRADLDGNGELDIADFVKFQMMFAAGDMRVDFDGDGSLDFFDVLAYQNMFSGGCP